MNSSNESRAYRGGSWYDHPVNCRAANRDWFSLGDRNVDLGLRLALSAPRLAKYTDKKNANESKRR